LRKQRKVKRLSYLPYSQLVLLMRGARALLWPSIYEGFGLPILEAMTLGTPVMTSNAACLPEIAGDAALLVDALDVEGITKAIRTLDSDDDLRLELQRRGPQQAKKFSPEKYQERVGALYRNVLGSSKALQKSAKPQDCVGPEAAGVSGRLRTAGSISDGLLIPSD
jgi:glycosyltransferase involved in cell wall biosynthesis